MSRRVENKDDGGLVYSTQHGKMCPNCSQPIHQCVCKTSQKAPTGDGIVRITKEIKGRKGKCVTVITGIPLPSMELVVFGKHLKKICGSGGTVKDGIIELQGDHCDRMVEVFKKRGWKAKKSGG